MKRTLLTLALALVPSWAMSATYYIRIGGNDLTGNGASATAYHTSTKAFSVMVWGDVMIRGYGVWFSSRDGSGACTTINGDNNVFGANTSSLAVIITGETPFEDVRSTATVRVEGCATAFDLFNTSRVEVRNHHIVNSSRAIQIYDCANGRGKFQKIFIKNGANYLGDFQNVIDISDDGNNPDRGSSMWLFEDITIDSNGRYGLINGGSEGPSEFNVFRRVVVRMNGNYGNQPKGGIVNYGKTGTIIGAKDSLVQNSIALNFNNASPYFEDGGEDVYGGFYMPWAPERVEINSSISMDHGEGWRGFAMSEVNDTPSTTSLINSVAFNTNKQAVRITGTESSSITIIGCTLILSTHDTEGRGISADVPITVNRNIIERNAQGPAFDPVTCGFNAFESTTSHGGCSDSVEGIHSVVYVTSVTDPALIPGRIGATIIYKQGKDGTWYGQPGYNDTQAERLWPYPLEGHIKAIFQMADSGHAKLNNPTNNPNRRWAGTNKTLTNYIWTYMGAACPDEICTAAAADCTGTTLVSSFSITHTSSFTVSFSSVGSSFIAAMSSMSDHSVPMSSGTILAPPTTYVNLTAGVTYYFKVKIATEGDCGYTTNISTFMNAPAAGGGGASPTPSFNKRRGLPKGLFNMLLKMGALPQGEEPNGVRTQRLEKAGGRGREAPARLRAFVYDPRNQAEKQDEFACRA